MKKNFFAAIIFSSLSLFGADEWPIFAMDNGLTQIADLNAKAKLLYELGYTGIGWRPPNTPQIAAALQAYGLKVYTSYVSITVQNDKYVIPIRVEQAITEMSGTGGAIWLCVAGESENDAAAVNGIIATADKAKAAGLTVVLYPHVGKFITADFMRAVRLVQKINRPDVRVSFTLCHFLKLHNEDELAAAFKQAAPFLAIVQVSGADSGDTKTMGMNRLIQPVGEGTFDLSKIVKLLREIDYQGPVTFQTYKIAGDNRDILQKCITNWRKIVNETE